MQNANVDAKFWIFSLLVLGRGRFKFMDVDESAAREKVAKLSGCSVNRIITLASEALVDKAS